MEARSYFHGVERKGDPYPKLVMGQVTSIQVPFLRSPLCLALERDFGQELVWCFLYVIIDWVVSFRPLSWSSVVSGCTK